MKLTDKMKQGLESFLGKDQKESKKDEVVLEAKTGLIERVEKKLVMQDGRQLIREQIFRDAL